MHVFLNFNAYLPQGRGIATIQANRNCALFLAMLLADKGVCYAHPSSHAGHVADPEVWTALSCVEWHSP